MSSWCAVTLVGQASTWQQDGSLAAAVCALNAPDLQLVALLAAATFTPTEDLPQHPLLQDTAAPAHQPAHITPAVYGNDTPAAQSYLCSFS